MPLLFIHAINTEYQSRDTGQEYARAADALRIGVQSAAAIAVDEINKGKTSTAIEVRVEQEDGTPILRSVVSMSVSPLMAAISPTRPTSDGPDSPPSSGSPVSFRKDR